MRRPSPAGGARPGTSISVGRLAVLGADQTRDPEVVITEMRAKGTLTTTGRPFTTTSVQIIRIVIDSTGHNIPRNRPDVVADTILEVAAQIRTGS